MTYGYNSVSRSEPSQVEIHVYKKPCGPMLSHTLDKGFNTVLGLSFMFLAVMLVSALLSIALYLNMGTEESTAHAFSTEDPNLPLHFHFFKDNTA
ncbi:CD82 antigen-like [Arapaima gigas]